MEYEPIGRIERFKRWTIAFIIGSGVGAYGTYNFEHGKLAHLESLVFTRGYCGDWDIDHNRHLYPCRDAAVAMDAQARAVQYDQETAAIMADMAKAADTPKKPTRAKKP